MMDNESPQSRPVGLAGWIAIIILIGLLIASVAYAVYAWGRMGNTQISTFGWFMLGLGVFFTLSVGVGLMGLVFYSSRKNFDR